MLHLTDALLLLLVCASAVTDLSSRRILNAFTYPAIAAGILLNMMDGLTPMVSSVVSVLISFAIYYPVCRIGGMGLGDVKLMAAIGALMGFSFWVRVQIASALLGGVMALAVAAYHGRLIASISGSLAIIHVAALSILGRRRFRLPPSAFRYAIPYGVAIAAGAVAAWCYSWPT